MSKSLARFESTPITSSDLMPQFEIDFEMDELGWCNAAKRIPSPNCDARPAGQAPDMLVIHNIHLPALPAGALEFTGPDIERLFTNTLDVMDHADYAELAKLRVSAHFLIRRSGEILQFVPCTLRAWHAGVSRWQARERCNDFSIGIELEGSDFVPFMPAQYTALNLLAAALQRHYPLAFLLGHSEIAPGRKTDPGPYFYWDLLSATILELRQTGNISQS